MVSIFMVNQSPLMTNDVVLDVSWLRLDFETFTLKGPADTVETSGGACTDKFTVTVINFNNCLMIFSLLIKIL